MTDPWTIENMKQQAAAIAESVADPVPRPTCGTCPHFVPMGETPPNELERYGRRGGCFFGPIMPGSEDCLAFQSTPGCGQHPDMPAWIKTEWPKVRERR